MKACFVMKHYNTWKDENNDFYARTPTPVSFNLVLALAAKRVALGKSQTIACLNFFAAFLHAKMKDEVHIQLDGDTLRMIHEENMTNLKPFVWTQRLPPILEGRRGRGSKEILDSSRVRPTTLCTWIQEISSSTCMWTTSFSQGMIGSCATWCKSSNKSSS